VSNESRMTARVLGVPPLVPLRHVEETRPSRSERKNPDTVGRL
jgi:hypothetical protein